MQTKFFDPTSHIGNLVTNNYYANLIKLREVIAKSCDRYFEEKDAPRIDLFMIAKGVSSPMGKGSDSLPIPFMLGEQHVFLVDSAQFGMEPIVLNKNFDTVYCYLPSFRGEDADDRHMNQFFHCEAELKGDYKACMDLAEGLVKKIVQNVVTSAQKKKFHFEKDHFADAEKILSQDFPRVSFDEVVKIFKKKKLSHLVEQKSFGQVISNEGEKAICELLTNSELPVWITQYDRDVVPFYQQPDPKNPEKALNADLVFPAIDGAFGGEIVGSGQRQNSVESLHESMKRQNITHPEVYDWYVNLRNHPQYQTTSGFGLGIERLIAWLIGSTSIIDSAIYPVLKDQKIYY